jgi:hypothetical protein
VSPILVSCRAWPILRPDQNKGIQKAKKEYNQIFGSTLREEDNRHITFKRKRGEKLKLPHFATTYY